mmetsp:Transcript_17798/g.35172  ORF Transcript_17798/g.35172 Transcript_17798/m.35172 type:complete len:395 (+) Transcript_17798:466-1650(+)
MDIYMKTIATVGVVAAVVARQRAVVRQQKLRKSMHTVELYVTGMAAKVNCDSDIKSALQSISGVQKVTVNTKLKRVVTLADASVKEDDLIAKLKSLGLSAKVTEPENKIRRVKLRVTGMMCDKNCGANVIKALKAVTGVQEAMASAQAGTANILVEDGVKDKDLVTAVQAIGFEAEVVHLGALLRRKVAPPQDRMRHACIRDVIPQDEITQAFEGVKKYYHEQQLQEYSRYKNWTQSCYMECHEHWSPQVPVTEALRDAMKPALEQCRLRFKKWYEDLHGLKDAEVFALNSFITKYIPVKGKEEFGKHVDSAKADGSLILALPTDDPHDWPGIKIWDGPKGADGERPEHTYVLQPGDICCMDALVWHHGLPITKGARYVAVCFYRCKWKEVKGI